MPALAEPYRRYLRVLELEARSPGPAALSELVRRHLCRVPFENVSKLLLYRRERVGRPVRLEEFLDGLEHQDLGGTCYSSNPFLAELLRALGYDATLLGADMSEPNVHTVVHVRIGGRAYHVDVGYASPFYEPVPLDAMPVTIQHGRHEYRVERAEAAESCRVTMFVDAEPRHGYLAHPPPREASFFRPTIVASFQRHRTFMNVLRITRFFDGCAVELRNRRLLRHTREATTERVLSDPTDLRGAVDTEFRMPRCPVEDAVRILEELSGRPFFSDVAWADAV